MKLPATKGITVVSGCGANESVMESTHQWITTVVIIHTLLRRWPLAGWWLLMRIWSEPSTLALSSTPPSTALCGCQATALWGGKGLVEAFELMVRMPQSVHSVLAKLQPTTTVEPRRGKILKNDRNTNILSPRQLLAASRITEALDKCVSNRSGWGGGAGVWKTWFTRVCLCGRCSSASSRLLPQLTCSVVFRVLSQLQRYK